MAEIEEEELNVGELLQTFPPEYLKMLPKNFLMNTTLDLRPSQPLFSSLYNYSKAIRRDRNGMFREVEGRFFKELS